MESFTLEIERRQEHGKTTARRLRRNGKLPAVVYHRGEESISACIGERQFVQLASRARSSQVFRFQSEDKALDGRSAIVRDVQKEYLKNNVLHVDFHALKDDEAITVDTPVVLSGEAPGVKTEGGVLQAKVHEISVSCLPKDIPGAVNVDISRLRLNQSVHAKDIPLPEGVSLASDPELTVVTILAVRTSVAVTDGADEEESSEA